MVGKPRESLATLRPMGHWAWGERELTMTVDKLRVVRGPVPEDRLAPRVQVNLDELEEDLNDYKEYIHTEAEGAGGPLTPEEFRWDATGTGGPLAGLGEEVPAEDGGGVEAPEGEPPEGEDGPLASGWRQQRVGGTHLKAGYSERRGRRLSHAEKRSPSQGRAGWDKGRGLPRQERSIGAPAQIAREMCGWNQSRGGLQPREPSGGHCWLTHC